VSETWVHGNVFAPGVYGPDYLEHVNGVSWSDQQGLKFGYGVNFVMKDLSQNM
jgi:hypothetical protein